MRTSEEFTPGFDQFAVDNFGGVQLRPDNLEYIQITDQYEKRNSVLWRVDLPGYRLLKLYRWVSEL